MLYGDILMDVDLSAFVNFHKAKGGVGSVFVHPNDHPQDSDLVVADAASRVTSFLPKPHRPGADCPIWSVLRCTCWSRVRSIMSPPRVHRIGVGRCFHGLVASGSECFAYQECRVRARHWNVGGCGRARLTSNRAGSNG